MPRLLTIHVILFDGYEPLDAFGPVEVLGDHARLRYFSADGGLVACRQDVKIQTEPFSQWTAPDAVLIPGGQGTRPLSQDAQWLKKLQELCASSRYVLSVCTGSALLACAGLLDGRRATTNKNTFSWVTSLNDRVRWAPCARWVVDGPFYTASGVSAGIDMALAFVGDVIGPEAAAKTARRMEYLAHDHPDEDPFAVDESKA